MIKAKKGRDNKYLPTKNKKIIAIIETIIVENLKNDDPNKLIKLIDQHPQVVNVKWVYWRNDKHSRLTKRSWSRERLAKMGVDE